MMSNQKKNVRCVLFVFWLSVSFWHPAPPLRSPPLHSLLMLFTQLFAFFPRIAPPPHSLRGCKSRRELSPDWIAGLPVNVRSAQVSLTVFLSLSTSLRARTGIVLEYLTQKRTRVDSDIYELNPITAKS